MMMTGQSTFSSAGEATRALTPDRLALNTATLGANVEGEGQGWGPDQIVDACAERGFAGITFWQRELETCAVRIGDRMAASGLLATGFCRTPYLLEYPEVRSYKDFLHSFQRSLEIAAQVGAPTITCVVGGLPRKTCDAAVALDILQDRLEKVVPLAVAAGVKIALEPLHPFYAANRSCLTTTRDAVKLCRRVGSPYLTLALDVYHIWWDTTLGETLSRRGEVAISAVHICDWLRKTDDPLLDRGMMGDGVVDIRALRRTVERAGYEGLYEVEIFSRRNWWRRDPDNVLDTIVERAAVFC